MKSITSLLLCFLLLCTCGVTAFAAYPEDEVTDTVISATVPKTHKIAVTAENAAVLYDGIDGDTFDVERLSEPRLLIRAESGKIVRSVFLDGVDVTDQLRDGYLTLSSVYEDVNIVVITEDAPSSTPQTGENSQLQFWWLLLLGSAACMMVLEIYRRKKHII